MFLNGERVWARSGATFDAIDPATAQVFARVALGDKADVDSAVASAHAAMGGWAGLPPVRRVRLLNRLAGLLRERSREFAELESLDVGKPLRQAEDDVAAAAGYFEYFAGVADKVFGSSIPLGKGFVDFTLREPLGVSAQIVPWNYPLRLASRGIAPALASGNAVVAKPAAEAGLSIVRLAELAAEAGLPPGVFNVVTGGRETGAALASHPGINQITEHRFCRCRPGTRRRIGRHHVDAELGADLYRADSALARGVGPRPVRRPARHAHRDDPHGPWARQPGHGPGR